MHHLVLGNNAGSKKMEECQTLLRTGQNIIKLSQQELELHTTQVEHDLMLTLDDLVPRHGISLV